MTSLGMGGGLFPSISPTPRLGHARTRASFCLRGRAVLVACNSLTSVGAWGPGLPPIHRLGRAHALPVANTIFNSNYISNLNVKSESQSKLCHHILDVGSGGVHCLDLTWHSNFKLNFQYYGSSPGYLLRLMFVYTTSDIYLTLSNIQI
jgi:hypothetical protein